VIVTHELDSLYNIADRMMFLDADEHRPIAIGPPSELAISATSEKVRDFLRRHRHSSSELASSGHAS
jgi:phospholipid/cholesterol/gamma-HCH transport system ATP-binding protein